MNSYTVKILIFFLSVFMLITISSQVYFAFQDNYEAETAVLYTASEKASFKGVYIRNETVLEYDGTGVISYAESDGNKVAKNSVIASIYNSEREAVIEQTIEKYRKELRLLQKAQNKGTVQVAQPEFLSQQINQKYSNIAVAVEKNDYETIESERSELLTLMNIMKLVVKKETDYNSRIEFLESRITSLESQLGAPAKTLSVDNEGYFVSYVDGYEDDFNFETTGSLTPEIIDNVKDEKITAENSDKIGKLIDGYKWKMAGVINNAQNRYTVGTKAMLKIESSPDMVEVTIDEIINTSDPEKSVIIISCDKLTYEYVQHRCERAELILNEYTGIKVPRSAIRFLNGEKGVYVQMGQQVTFRKINVIFEGDDYVLSENTSESGYLMLYDDVVVEGIKQLEVTTAPPEENTTNVTGSVTENEP